MIFPHGAIHTIIRDATVPRAPRSRCRPIRKKLIFSVEGEEGEDENKITKFLISSLFLSFSDLAGRVISSSFFFLMTFILQLPVDIELRHPTLCV